MSLAKMDFYSAKAVNAVYTHKKFGLRAVAQRNSYLEKQFKIPDYNAFKKVQQQQQKSTSISSAKALFRPYALEDNKPACIKRKFREITEPDALNQQAKIMAYTPENTTLTSVQISGTYHQTYQPVAPQYNNPAQFNPAQANHGQQVNPNQSYASQANPAQFNDALSYPAQTNLSQSDPAQYYPQVASSNQTFPRHFQSAAQTVVYPPPLNMPMLSAMLQTQRTAIYMREVLQRQGHGANWPTAMTTLQGSCC